MQRIDNSSAARFVSFFIERVARELALVSKPTWSTDGVRKKSRVRPGFKVV